MKKTLITGGFILCVLIAATLTSTARQLEYVNSIYWTDINDLKLRGDYAYCCFGSGLVIYDMTTLSFPLISSRIFIQGSNKHIELHENYAYMFGKDDMLRVIDITSPINPRIVGELPLNCEVYNIRIRGNYIFAAAGELGLAIIDISDPEQPEVLTLYDTDGITGAVDIQDDYVFIAEKQTQPSMPSFQVLDITDILNPYAIGAITDQIISACDLIVEGDIAYLADQTAGFTTIKLTNLSQPEVLAQISSSSSPHNLHFNDPYVFMDKDNEWLQVYDVTDPASPQLAGDFLPEKPIMDFDLTGSQLFTAGAFEGISILDIYDVDYIFQLTEIDRRGAITSSFMVDDVLYVGESQQGLMVHDLSDQGNPNQIGFSFTPYQHSFTELNENSIFLLQDDQIGEIYLPDPTTPLDPMYYYFQQNYSDACINLPYLFLTKPEGGLDIYLRHNFVALQYLRSYEWTSQTGNVEIENGRAYIAQYPNICIFDISDPTDSVLLGSYEPANQVQKLWVKDSYVYSSGHDATSNQVSIYDCADPENPVFVDDIAFEGSVLDITFHENLAIFAVLEAGIIIYDCANPENPIPVDQYRTPGIINEIAIFNDYLYLADNSSLVILRFSPTGIENIDNLPEEYRLSQNYPNPFNAATTISYSLPEQSKICIEVFDILGRKVQTLFEGEQPAGIHSLTWNADSFSSGIYFYKLSAADIIRTEKMLLIK